MEGEPATHPRGALGPVPLASGAPYCLPGPALQEDLRTWGHSPFRSGLSARTPGQRAAATEEKTPGAKSSTLYVFTAAQCRARVCYVSLTGHHFTEPPQRSWCSPPAPPTPKILVFPFHRKENRVFSPRPLSKHTVELSLKLGSKRVRPYQA